MPKVYSHMILKSYQPAMISYFVSSHGLAVSTDFKIGVMHIQTTVNLKLKQNCSSSTIKNNCNKLNCNWRFVSKNCILLIKPGYKKRFKNR